MVAFCLGTAWLGGQLELSEELGAFVAGAMVASAERALVARGLLVPSNSLTSPLSVTDHDLSPASAAETAALLACSNSAGMMVPAAPPAAVPTCANIESISNVLTALFVASIGLIMSPVFLWHHALVLLAGTAVVMAVKAAVVSGVVQVFGVAPRIAWAVGLTMAHTGEFSFVLLSMAHQLELLPETVRRRRRCCGCCCCVGW